MSLELNVRFWMMSVCFQVPVPGSEPVLVVFLGSSAFGHAGAVMPGQAGPGYRVSGEKVKLFLWGSEF